MTTAKSFFQTHPYPLGLAATIYTLMLLFSHWQLPSQHVWLIATVFSVIMNFTYVIEALSLSSFIKTETTIASLLITCSIAGFVFSPLLLIAAIIGHGLWDLQKHFGRGVPFFFWYTCSCFIVDTIYGATLFAYFLQQA